MEPRIWSLWGFLVVLAVVSHCSVNGHVMERRSVDDDDFLGDEGIDDEAQKDEGNDEAVEGVIQTERKSYTVETGLSVRLACVVSPDAVSVVNWDKLNGDVVVPLSMNKMKMMKPENPLYNKTEIISEGGVHDLVIHNVVSSDSGEYRCLLPQDKPVSVVHSLRVGPRIVSLAANNNVLPEGSDLVLTCKVEGTPPPQIIWSRVGAGRENPNERLKEKDGEFSFDTVTIKNVKGHHSGKYYCYALNNMGNTQKEIDIKVLEKPHAHVHKTEINTGIGDHAIFQCTVSRGDPIPQITWFKDNVPVLVDNKRFFISTDGSHSNLTVVPAGISDFGTYTCVAQNYHGVHNRSAELVQRPVIDDIDVNGPKLSFRVHSHLPLEQVEVQLIDQTGNPKKFELPQPKTLQKSYDFSFEVSEAPGTYQAFVRAKNEKEWSRNTDPIKINIEAEPINIQKSSMFLPSHAHSIRHSATLLSSALMYLLVRML